MKKILNIAILVSFGLGNNLSPQAQKNVDYLFNKYSSKGAKNFDAQKGKIEWNKEHKVTKRGKTQIMSCKKCHTSDLTKQTKHYKTGKTILPIAPSANKDAFGDLKHIKKWFRRNCKQVYKRECGPQEKGDFLKYMIGE